MSLPQPQLTPQLPTSLGDNIQSLPTDQTMPSHDEIQIMETLFKQNNSTIQKLLSGVKEFIVLFILFIVLSIPATGDLLRKLLPISESPYMGILIRACLFVVVYFIITNLYLVRN